MFKVIILNIIALMLVLAPNDLYAQYSSIITQIGDDGSYDRVFMPELTSTSVIIDDDDLPSVAPFVYKVKFLRIPILTGNKERVDRLIQGVTKDIPPEYDHYGYEIRRYMVNVFDLKVFEDKDYLMDQISNVKKAKVIANYWRDHLESEIEEIEEVMDNDPSLSFAVRTYFNNNKSVVRTFLFRIHSWINANERALMLISENTKVYKLLYPEIIIVNSKIRRKFYDLYSVKQTTLMDINQYSSFAIMVH